MQNEELLYLAIIAASLQVIIQFLGMIKAFLDYLAVRKNAKGPDRSRRSKPKKNKHK